MNTKPWFIAVVMAAALFVGASPALAQDDAVKPLNGTIWRCVSSDDNSTNIWQFADNGEMNYIFDKNAQVSFGNKWRQEGARITVDINGGYAVYKGEFRSPSSIEGAANNVQGLKWTFKLTLMNNSAEIRRYEKIFKTVKKDGIYIGR